MKIYTKTGDKGLTSLYGGKRVNKDDLKVECYGTIDELNAFMGLVNDSIQNNSDKAFITSIQNDLFLIGSIIATPTAEENANKRLKTLELKSTEIIKIEEKIDIYDKILDPMTHFILPGGHTTVSYCHTARSICRRAERRLVSLMKIEDIDNNILIYLNRLSDFLFILARKLAKDLQINELKWIP
jgi:cob(I)alamin adenosyltransferase